MRKLIDRLMWKLGYVRAFGVSATGGARSSYAGTIIIGGNATTGAGVTSRGSTWAGGPSGSIGK